MADSTDTYRYWAFISYSSKDAPLARKLHRRLESYSIPRDLRGRPGLGGPVPKKIFPIFRDRDELPLSSDLGATIEDALRASRFLVVLCSRAAARSRWVNEEIRFFKSLGRENRILAIIADGEPNASDQPATADQECFPPALRYRIDANARITEQRTEPIAGDLRPGGDGWHNVFLKAVAGITGLGFDAFARRERKRRRRRQIAAGIAATLLLVCVAWAWDYNRLKIENYADVAIQWGAPVGVMPLEGSATLGHVFYYRVESRRGRVRRATYVDRAGRAAEDSEGDHGSIQDVSYREDGSVEEIDVRRPNGKLVMRKIYSELRNTNEGQVQFVDYRQENQDAPLTLNANVDSLDFAAAQDSSTRSDITAKEFFYDTAGRPVKVSYLNAYHRKRANAQGVYGQRVTYAGASPTPAAGEYLGYDGTPEPDRTGILGLRQETDPVNGSHREHYYDAAHAPALMPDGYSERVVAFDAKTDSTRVEYFGIDGKPALTRGGYHSETVTLDKRGTREDHAYFGVNGEPVFSTAGFHRRTQHNDARGNAVEDAFFGADDRPVYLPAGYHSLRQTFDSAGNTVRVSFYGTDGKPVLVRERYHRIDQRFDRHGNVIEAAYFGLSGEPVEAGLNDGKRYHRATLVLDDSGNVVDAAYFDVRGQAESPLGDTFTRYRQKFDERGNLIDVRLYDGERPVVSGVSGHHRQTQTYDNGGNLSEMAYFGVDGAPVVNRALGFHRTVTTYDERGRAIEDRSFGVNGEPILTSTGFYRATHGFDAKGNLLVTDFFGIHGEPVTNQGDCHRLVSKYDAHGNTTELSCFGTDGKPSIGAAGSHRTVNVFDARGNLTEVAYFGVDQQPLGIAGGVHRSVNSYNGLGDRIEEDYFDVHDAPTSSANGYHRLRRTLDARRREIGEEFFGTDGEPVLNDRGWHRIAKAYDARGNEIEETYFGTNGEPVADLNGIQRVTFVMNAYDGIDRMRYYDDRGQEVTAPGGPRLLGGLFESCNFMLPHDNPAVAVVVVPAKLPPGKLELYVQKSYLSFVADGRLFADVPLEQESEAYRRLVRSDKAGIVEFPPGTDFPDVITNIMAVRIGTPPGLPVRSRVAARAPQRKTGP